MLAGGNLISVGPAGLARLDPVTEGFTEIGGCCGDLIGSDGQAVWLENDNVVTRVDPSDGVVVATFPFASVGGIAFGGGRAWLTVFIVGVVEIDLATNEVVRTIPVLPAPSVPLESEGVLWVTDVDNSYLWRIEP